MASSPSDQFTPPSVGDFLDIFKLRSELHKGAMATLFLAEDMLSGQQVVLKIPCGDILNQPILLYHYQNEERISRLLDHPGIIQFIHRQRSRQYIIMEHIAGRDLRSQVGRDRCLELQPALTLMDELCGVVAYLHDRGVVHLDLKPENIICCQNNEKKSSIKLIDFGLAHCRHLPDLLHLDLKNPHGTPWYIAPEQLLGDRTDPRSDIYSLGMLLYEMLTGCLPWPRSSKLSVSRRRLRHDPIPPRHFNPDIPPQIQAVILCAIKRHADKRYSDVREMRHDLQCWQQLGVTEFGSNTRPPSLWQRLLPGRSVRLRKVDHTEGLSQKDEQEGAKKPPQIIGAIIDYPHTDNIIAEVKKQALIHGGEVTLVHIIEEESDCHFTRYGIAVEGERLMAGLERAVQLLRRCSIDPTIRLIRGEVVDVLAGLCADLDATALILGKSRKKERLLSGASVLKKLKKDQPCPVIVSDEEQFLPASGLAALEPDQLTPRQALATDIFLVDLWYEHLHYHTDFIYSKLLYPGKIVDHCEDNCAFGRFLTTFVSSAQWQEATAILHSIHREFHQVAARMDKLSAPTDLEKIYINESLPLSCKLKKELAHVSLRLRQHIEQPPPDVPFLTDQTCPVTQPNLPCYGSLLRAFNLGQDLCVLAQSTPPPS